MTDLRAKLDRELADFDLLLIPRADDRVDDGSPIAEGLP